MKAIANAHTAIRALRANKLRSWLSILGVVIGVASVLTSIAVGAGAHARVTEQIESMGANLILVWATPSTVGGVRLAAGTRPTVTEDDAWAIQREIPLVEAAAPFTSSKVVVVHRNQNWSTVLQAVTPEFLQVRDWEVIAGREISQAEAASKVALVGLTAAEKLFGDDDPVGQVVRIQNVPFTVIGVLERKGQSAWGQDQDDNIFVPLSTARRSILGRDPAGGRAVGSISVKVHHAALMKAAEAEIRALLRQRHRLLPNQEDDFVLRNLTAVLASLERSSGVLTILLTSIASVSLLVGGVGIMNIMLVSVTERTREIGLRCAVGARRRDILMQFLAEAIVLAFTGGVVGIGLGLAGAYAIAHFAQWRVLIQPQAVLLALGVALAVGVASGLYPARRASTLEPAVALRRE